MKRTDPPARQRPLSATVRTAAGAARTVLGLVRDRFGVDVHVAVPAATAARSVPRPDDASPMVTDAIALDETVGLPAAGEAPADDPPTDVPARAELAATETQRLVLLEVIGRGGMGLVHLGHDTDLRRDLAVKFVDVGGPVDARAAITRFIEEAQITAQLEHPGIVPVHELGVDAEGEVFFTMKLVRGRSLGEILRARQAKDPETVRRFGLRRLINVFVQVTRAVEYAHARDVIHRDLKPDNVMIGEYGEVLVMDWGLAKVIGAPARDRPSNAPHEAPPSDAPDSSSGRISTVRTDAPMDRTRYGTVVGTPLYMAPEQARGDLDALGPRTDIYSLGVILYQILCGHLPFSGPTADSVLEQHLATTPPLPSSRPGAGRVPKALETLCMAMLEKDPSARRVTLAQARARIQDYVEGIATEAEAEGLARRATRLAAAVAAFVITTGYLGVGARDLLEPEAVFYGAGWFLLVWHLLASLTGLPTLLGVLGRARVPFTPVRWDEVYAAAMMSDARQATAVAPVFQLGFLAQLGAWFTVVILARAGAGSLAETADALRLECRQALVVPMLFLGAWFYAQYEEVRFARSADLYAGLIRRSRWEIGWPILLGLMVLGVELMYSFGRWRLGNEAALAIEFWRGLVANDVPWLALAKTLVANATFLGIVVGAMMLVQFPLSEILASLRLGQLGADEGDVEARTHYYLRSLAVAHVARVSCLYAGAAVAVVGAINVLGGAITGPPLELLALLAGPPAVGVLGFWGVRTTVRRYLANNPTVAAVAKAALDREQRRERAARRRVAADRRPRARLWALALAFAPILAYALWNAAASASDLQGFWSQVPRLEWLMPVPYVLLGVGLVARDRLYLRRTRRPGDASTPLEEPPAERADGGDEDQDGPRPVRSG